MSWLIGVYRCCVFYTVRVSVCILFKELLQCTLTVSGSCTVEKLSYIYAILYYSVSVLSPVAF